MDASTAAATEAAAALEDIIERGAAVLFDHSLKAAEGAFVRARCALDVKLLAAFETPALDGVGAPAGIDGGSWAPDEEPIAPPLDTWARTAVPTHAPALVRARRGPAPRAVSAAAAAAAAASANAAAIAAAVAHAGSRAPSRAASPNSHTSGRRSRGADGGPAGSSTLRGGVEAPLSAPASQTLPPELVGEHARFVAELERKRLAQATARSRALTEAQERVERDGRFAKALRGKT
jgi:hypothetical protein